MESWPGLAFNAFPLPPLNHADSISPSKSLSTPFSEYVGGAGSVRSESCQVSLTTIPARLDTVSAPATAIARAIKDMRFILPTLALLFMRTRLSPQTFHCVLHHPLAGANGDKNRRLNQVKSAENVERSRGVVHQAVNKELVSF